MPKLWVLPKICSDNMENVYVQKLKNAFQGDLKEYRSIPFWSWNNSVEESELLNQIDQMKRVGIGGFIIHARIGLNIEYLGEKWFSCVEACLERARQLDMNVWIYDENGFPSGSAGGKLLETERYRARFLRYEIKDRFDESAFCVFEKTADGYRRLDGGKSGLSEYHTVYLSVSPSDTDILNPEVVDAFIAETHEKYYSRFKDSFGKELAGFFTDEPQYYRYSTPYSAEAEKEYYKRFGEDVKDGLIYLFCHDERGYAFRERYYGLLNELYTENYYKKLYDWCDSHGCKLTGHSVEETALYRQMWGGAACMPSYEYEHIPGVDCLERDCGSELAPKQAGSVASQLGRKFVLTETFGCSGYDVTPKELKSLGEFQYFNGVNLMCQHLMPYSLGGQGKYDFPPVFSPHNNWWDEFKIFNDYFTRLGFIVANTEETYDVLVLHPMRGIWLDYIREEDGNSVADLEESFARLLKKFRKKGVRFQLADERILQRYGKAEGEKLAVGRRLYDTVVVPDMKTLSASTASLLKEYKGRICYMGEIRYVDGKPICEKFSSNVSIDEVCENTAIKFSCEDGLSGMTSRSGEIGDYIFVKNYSRTESSSVSMPGISESYKAIDLQTLSLRPVYDEERIGACESLILIRDDKFISPQKDVHTEDVTERFRITDISENSFVMDYASMSTDGETFGESMPLSQIFEGLLRKNYRGKIYIRQAFVLREKMPLCLVMEKSDFLKCEVNGRGVAWSKDGFDIAFMRADITEHVKEGENLLLYALEFYQHEGVSFALFDPMATESARTRLYYDTQIENSYLKGDFVVEKDFSLSKREAYPAVSADNYKNGYPFFFGTVTLSGTYNYDGTGRRIMSLSGRYMVAEAEINGKKRSFVLSEKNDLTDLLKIGENKIVLRVKSSLRNLFGPHHLSVMVEPMGVCPFTFTMRGDWKNGVSSFYTHEYNCVPFGIDKIEIHSIRS